MLAAKITHARSGTLRVLDSNVCIRDFISTGISQRQSALT